MDQIKIKQQVIDKLKQAEKVLVTVSKNPSVDALSAALGLTLLLDQQGKYATAIFSGETPPALAFLEPEKTFDDTTDSLRDFIIALNKEKADHLRYKVVDEAVKIFITPYKTTITEDDLEFSQGDYNVELVVAIGVDDQEDLDSALDNHGQILHDAAIMTLSAGDRTSALGGIDWHDKAASSLSEMVGSLVDGLKKDKKDTLLTAPIATALLTGIVAETERFSNERTTSKSMTIAATLMAAGADQQLIANELQSAEELAAPVSQPEATPHVDALIAPATEEVPVEAPASTVTSDGGLSIHHDPAARPKKSKARRKKKAALQPKEGETLAELDKRVRGKSKEELMLEEAKLAAEAPKIPTQQVAPAEEAAPAEEIMPAEQVAPIVPSAPAITEVQAAASAAPKEDNDLPLVGGTLNATMAQAQADAKIQAESAQNRTILSHGYLSSDAPAGPGQTVVNSLGDDELIGTPEEGVPAGGLARERVIQPLGVTDPAPVQTALAQEAPVAPAAVTPAPVAPEAPVAAETPGTPESSVAPEEAALAAAFDAAAPAANAYGLAPAEAGLPMPPPIPDFSQMNGEPALPLPPAPAQAPEILGDILNPPADAPVINAYAPEGTMQSQVVSQSATVPLPATPDQAQAGPASGAYAADPGQFQIPAAQE